MPVQPIGEKNRKGALGSYYSISDYTAINPEFGTRGRLQGVRRRRAPAGDEGHPRLGGQPHRVRPPVDRREHPDYYVTARGRHDHQRARQRGARHRLDRRRGAELRQPAHAARDDRRHALVARTAWASTASAATSPAAYRPTSGSRRGASSPGRDPTCSCSPRRRIRSIHAAFDMTYAWRAASPAQRHRAGEEGHRRARRLLRARRQPVPPRRVPHVLHQQPRREQLERHRVRAHGRQPRAPRSC